MLVDQVRVAIVNERLTEVLNRLENLAQQTGLDELRLWCTYELKGYPRSYMQSGNRTAYYRYVAVEWTTDDNEILPAESISPNFANIFIPYGVSELEQRLGDDMIIKRHDLHNLPDSSKRVSGLTIHSREIESVFLRIRHEARTRLDNHFARSSRRRRFYLAPEFTKLVSNAVLADILQRRWDEANRAFEAQAYLSAAILLGSILEGVLLSKVEQNEPVAFAALSCPQYKGGPKPIGDWKLYELIEVAHECGWLRSDVKAFSHILRDYRNFIHPNKERLAGVIFDENTARIIWEVVSTALS
jgi:hypothetical protein